MLLNKQYIEPLNYNKLLIIGKHSLLLNDQTLIITSYSMTSFILTKSLLNTNFTQCFLDYDNVPTLSVNKLIK